MPAKTLLPVTEVSVAVRPRLLPSETEFYQAYAWCLNPYLTFRETVDHLRREIGRLTLVPAGWQAGEVATNIFLLSCSLSIAAEDYLRGPALRLPKRIRTTRLGRDFARASDRVTDTFRQPHVRAVRCWAKAWQGGLDDFVASSLSGLACDLAASEAAAQRLASLLPVRLPDSLQSQSIAPPSPFHRLDLTPVDVLALGRRFVTRFPDRSQAILLLGVRASGSYFVPLLRAFFKTEGYQNVSSLTVRPGKGLGHSEGKQLRRYARQGYSCLIVDDPPHTGHTIFLTLDLCRQAGFARERLRVLAPTHSARRTWAKSFPDHMVLSLEPEEWHKQQLLEPALIEIQLREYYQAQGVFGVRVIATERAEALNQHLHNLLSDERASRLKRIYEIQLASPRGVVESRFVLAKSVGWGWLGYHAYLAGERLSSFVPPILGLRDGTLYTEWIGLTEPNGKKKVRRDEQIETSAAYVAARVRHLSLATAQATGEGLKGHEEGVLLLETVFSRAYGRFFTDTLAGPRLRRRLRRLPCPRPTLIDGRMRTDEWIDGPAGSLKTDYEHHGLGKARIGVMDPAYDLAETILDLSLTQTEERRLIQSYVERSGDSGVEERLLINKLLAGFWTMTKTQRRLLGKSPISMDRQQESHRRFLNAWHFLTVQTARFCGSLCSPRKAAAWRAPVVMLDLDGVLDRRVFGYPCPTAAGIEALALLGAHGFSVALNTARSAAEVRDYCQAYGFVGGVAEHGSYLWDAVAKRERVIISPETLGQLDQLRQELKRFPGVFLDSRHQYSIRAFTYEEKPGGLLSPSRTYVGAGAPVPLRIPLVHHLMTVLKLDRLSVHQTTIDTTIVARETDKGAGLTALRDWVLQPAAETIAVGDSEADLAMFKVATRSFAPSQISCATQARLLGCQIAPHPFQRGLLDIARTLAHPDGKSCEHCVREKFTFAGSLGLIMDLLQAADQTPLGQWVNTLLDPSALSIFLR